MRYLQDDGVFRDGGGELEFIVVEKEVVFGLVEGPEPVGFLLGPQAAVLGGQHQLIRKYLIDHCQTHLHVFLLAIGLLLEVFQVELNHIKVDIFRQLTRLLLPAVFYIAKELGFDLLVGVERVVEFLTEIHQAKSQETAVAEQRARLTPWVELLQAVMAVYGLGTLLPCRKHLAVALVPKGILQLEYTVVEVHHFEDALLFLKQPLYRSHFLDDVPDYQLRTEHLIDHHCYVEIPHKTFRRAV